MPNIEPHLEEAIKSLSPAELQKILLKVVRKEKYWAGYILVNYVDRKEGEQELYEKALSDINGLYGKSYKGFSRELKTANLLAACGRRINEFDRVCKSKQLVLDLLMVVLADPFAGHPKDFGTCFTAFNHKVHMLLKKAVTIYQTKIHDDYKIEYRDRLNGYLDFMHKHSNHLDYVHTMPKTL